MVLTMFVSVLPFLASDFAADTYEIKAVERTASFAGRMGELVHDNLTVERDGKSYTVIISGSYHTMNVRKSDRFAVGQKVSISSHPSDDGKIRVWLDGVRILK